MVACGGNAIGPGNHAIPGPVVRMVERQRVVVKNQTGYDRRRMRDRRGCQRSGGLARMGGVGLESPGSPPACLRAGSLPRTCPAHERRFPR